MNRREDNIKKVTKLPIKTESSDETAMNMVREV
jgi:hypothetical protein